MQQRGVLPLRSIFKNKTLSYRTRKHYSHYSDIYGHCRTIGHIKHGKTRQDFYNDACSYSFSMPTAQTQDSRDDYVLKISSQLSEVVHCLLKSGKFWQT